MKSNFFPLSLRAPGCAPGAKIPRQGGVPSWVIDVAILTILAALIRTAVLLATVDTPGDGPVRALAAYSWSQAPHLVRHGIWLPGFLYLTGLVSYLFPVWIAVRLLNVVVGAVTIPVFFVAVAPVFGPATAFLGAAWLAVFPLHVELSASSLTQVSAAFEMLLGMVFLRMAAQPEGRGRWAYAALATSAFIMASMTRYEVWVFLPLFPGYYWLRTRHLVGSAAMAALLFAGPVAWTLSNHVYGGQAFLGVAAAIHDRSWAATPVGVSVTKAGEILVTRFASRLGWVIVIGLLLGLVRELRSLVARRLSPERILHLAVVLIFLAGAWAFTVMRGQTLGDPYLLFIFILAMPIALIPASGYLSHIGRGGLWVVIVVALIYSLASLWLKGGLETHWVTTAEPQRIIRFAEWVNQSPWRDQPVVFTRMDWQPTYLPYYFPRYAWKTIIISEWIDDGPLLEMTQSVRPSLLVTQPGDEAYVKRFVKVTGMAVEQYRLVHRDGDVEVYALVDAQPSK